MSAIGCRIWRWVFESGDEKRMAKIVQDLSDLEIRRDIPYLPDGERGHLLDLYRLPGLSDEAPVMINIHGGGLFASYKEVNANFNYEWARLGYHTISISYRRLPEVYLKDQIHDVMRAMRWIGAHAGELGIRTDRIWLTGDSAGALLSHYVLSICGSRELQEAFGEEPPAFGFRAAGFISIFLDTHRKDIMRAVSDRVLAPGEEKEPYAPYILDPVYMVEKSSCPPLFLVTGSQDLIRKDTIKLAKALKKRHRPFRLLDFPAGEERTLDHVFAVKFPKWPESREVYQKMMAYFDEVKAGSEIPGQPADIMAAQKD